MRIFQFSDTFKQEFEFEKSFYSKDLGKLIKINKNGGGSGISNALKSYREISREKDFMILMTDGEENKAKINASKINFDNNEYLILFNTSENLLNFDLPESRYSRSVYISFFIVGLNLV